MTRTLLLALALLGVACADPVSVEPGEDAGRPPPDAAPLDSSALDATAAVDGGPEPDASGDAPDADAPDAGTLDAGALDAGALEPGDSGAPDAGAGDADAPDAAPLDPGDAGAPDADATDAGCVPSPEVCDRVDNDCNGLVDDRDVAGDGIFDCLRIALLGNRGLNGSSDFEAWLASNGVVAQRLQTAGSATITPALLSGYDVVILDALVRPYAAAEATTLRRWVEDGGALMSMTGYTGGQQDRERPNGLMAELGLEYLPGLVYGPVSSFAPHPTTDGLTSITFNGGFQVGETAAARTSTTTVIARLPGGPAAIVAERGLGRVHVWGDEWVTFDSEWRAQPEVRRFWVNALGWLRRYR